MQAQRVPAQLVGGQGHQAGLQEQGGAVPDRGEGDRRHGQGQRGMQDEDQVGGREQQPQRRAEPLPPPVRDEPPRQGVPASMPAAAQAKRSPAWRGA